ncbi:TPA: Ail/Lom family outer membrane beta-barrel protein [Escherichia coli]|nr:Ail/Lom family outer membrane beta-barrel protein [Escherichia coli]
MRRNLSHIIAAAFNEPLLLEPAYARVFFCALGREMGAASLSVPQQQVQLDAPGMLAETDEYMAGGKRPARVYRVVNGIAVLPVTGTLVHRLGGMRPFSGMTGYDGIVACLQQAMADNRWFSMMAGPSVRVNEWFSAYAMAGVAYSRVSTFSGDYLRVTDNKGKKHDVLTGSDDGRHSNTSLAWGAGVQFNPTESVAIDIAYEGSGSGDWRTDGFIVGVGYKF